MKKLITPIGATAVAFVIVSLLIAGVFVFDWSKSRGEFSGVVVIAGAATVITLWTIASKNALALTAIAIPALVGAGLWITGQFGISLGVTWSVASVGGVVLFALLAVMRRDGQVTKAEMRDAIAGAVVTTYLVSVGLSLFRRSGGQAQPSDVAQILVQNFTVVTTTVIGFYFGGGTIERVQAIRSVERGADPVKVAEVTQN